jgi:hypothetical protein
MHSGVLTLSQVKELNEASMETPIVFAASSLDHDADVWQVFDHSTDEEKRQLLDDPKTANRLYGYENQLRIDGQDDEADNVDAKLAATQ